MISTPSGPITVDGNDDFHTQVVSNGWDEGGVRNGDSTHLFLITRYDFDGQ